MQMDRVIFRKNHAGALQHHLHRRIERQPVQSRPAHRPHILRLLRSGVIERRRRPRGEIVGEYAADSEEMSVEERDPRHHDCDVVDVRHHAEAEAVVSARTMGEAEGDGEE